MQAAKTEEVLTYLDQILDLITPAVCEPKSIDPQFPRAIILQIKEHLVALANANREQLTYASMEELFTEIAKRHSSCILATADHPEGLATEEQVGWNSGSITSCVGLADYLGLNLRADMMSGGSGE